MLVYVTAILSIPLLKASLANTWPPFASDGAVRQKVPLSGTLLRPGEVADGDTIKIPFGTATFALIAPVTPEQSAPIIAVTPCATRSSAAAVAAAESTQVESASKIVIDSPPKRFPEFDASSNAILAPSLIAGVKDSIGPVKPRIIPTLISANAAVVTVDKLTITARSNFFIFPPKKYTFYIWYLIY